MMKTLDRRPNAPSKSPRPARKRVQPTQFEGVFARLFRSLLSTRLYAILAVVSAVLCAILFASSLNAPASQWLSQSLHIDPWGWAEVLAVVFVIAVVLAVSPTLREGLYQRARAGKNILKAGIQSSGNQASAEHASLLALRLSQVIALTAAAVVAVAFWHWATDDAYITFRYAYNFACGHGLVYNLGERYLGSTAPMFALLLGILAYGHPAVVPAIGAALSAASLAAICLALLALGYRHNALWAGLAASVFFCFSPETGRSFGNEMLPQLALIAWAFVLLDRDRRVGSTLLASLATTIRPDGAAALAVILLASAIKTRRLNAPQLLASALPIAIMLAWCALYYHALLPGSIGAKLAQTQSGNWLSYGANIVPFLQTIYLAPPMAIIGGSFFLLLAAFGLLLVPKISFARWLLAWVACQSIAYIIIRAPSYGWYYVPLTFGICLLAGLPFVLLNGLPKPRLAGAIAVVVVALFCAVNVAGVKDRGIRPDEQRQMLDYAYLGRWIDAHTAPNASVGYLEIGYLGYYSHRPIIDELGLVNQGVAGHVADWSPTWSFHHFQPSIIVVFAPRDGAMERRLLAEPWFRNGYRQGPVVPSRMGVPYRLYCHVSPKPATSYAH